MNASQPTVWLAAEYHLPSTYSYRMPMSSMAHAPTLPTPGPATVRLALLRRSLELFGEAMTRETLFPILREMLVRIRPPESVAISPHLLRASKWSEERRARHPRVQESLMRREVAHAKGLLTIYLQIPASAETRLRAVLQAIGYWGQTDSFACCLDIRQASPPEEECVMPLQHFTVEGRLQPFFSGLATEFRDPQLSWQEVTASPQLSKIRTTRQAIVLDLYIWPLVLLRQYDGNKLFQRQSLREAQV